MPIIITDTHLKNSNIETNKSIFLQAFNYAKEKDTFVIHAGDICDARVGWDAELQKVFHNILLQAEEMGVEIHCISGNHDKKNLNDEFSYLSPFKFHKSFNLYENTGHLDVDDVRYHFLPYFKEKELYPTKLSQCVSNTREGAKNVLITHISIEGVRNNDGTIVGDPHGVSKNSFKAFDTVIVGHYHNKQTFGNIHYIGSTFPHNYGETNDKGVLLFEGDTFEVLPTNFKKYFTKNINLQSENDVIATNNSNFNSDNSFVKVNITGHSSLVEAIDKKSIKADKITTSKTDFEIIKTENIKTVHNKNSVNQNFEEYCVKNSMDLKEGLKCKESP